MRDTVVAIIDSVFTYQEQHWYDSKLVELSILVIVFVLGFFGNYLYQKYVENRRIYRMKGFFRLSLQILLKAIENQKKYIMAAQV